MAVNAHSLVRLASAPMQVPGRVLGGADGDGGSVGGQAVSMVAAIQGGPSPWGGPLYPLVLSSTALQGAEGCSASVNEVGSGEVVVIFCIIFVSFLYYFCIKYISLGALGRPGALSLLGTSSRPPFEQVGLTPPRLWQPWRMPAG